MLKDAILPGLAIILIIAYVYISFKEDFALSELLKKAANSEDG